jgi:hypothetical protein
MLQRVSGGIVLSFMLLLPVRPALTQMLDEM